MKCIFLKVCVKVKREVLFLKFALSLSFFIRAGPNKYNRMAQVIYQFSNKLDSAQLNLLVMHVFYQKLVG